MLSTRDEQVRERMDDPDCDPVALRRTYGQFAAVNRLLAGWRRIYRHRIVPLLTPDRPSSLLDLGCGGGDVARALARWAADDGLPLHVTAVDPDPRAIAYAAGRAPRPGVSVRQAGTADLLAEGEQFDLVISNHVLHHLDAAGLDQVLTDSMRLSRRLVLHNDLTRHWAAYGAWSLVSWPFSRQSFLRTDGLASIRRSYTPAELAAIVPTGWQVVSQFPARLLLMHAPGREQSGG